MRRPASAVSHAVASGFLLQDLRLRSRSFLERESTRPKSAGKSFPLPRCPAARDLLSSCARELLARVLEREVAGQPPPSAFRLPAQMPRARSADAAGSCQSHQFSFASPRSSSLSSCLLEIRRKKMPDIFESNTPPKTKKPRPLGEVAAGVLRLFAGFTC